MERKERKDHAYNKALTLLAVMNGINSKQGLAKEIRKTERATFDILKELEEEMLLKSDREETICPHYTKKITYSLPFQDGNERDIIQGMYVLNFLFGQKNIDAKKFMRTEYYESITKSLSDIIESLWDGTFIIQYFAFEDGAVKGEDPYQKKQNCQLYMEGNLGKEQIIDENKIWFQEMVQDKNKPFSTDGSLYTRGVGIEFNRNGEKKVLESELVRFLGIVSSALSRNKLSLFLQKILLSFPSSASYLITQFLTDFLQTQVEYLIWKENGTSVPIDSLLMVKTRDEVNKYLQDKGIDYIDSDFNKQEYVRKQRDLSKGENAGLIGTMFTEDWGIDAVYVDLATGYAIGSIERVIYEEAIIPPQFIDAYLLG